jgi:hypothetical protein
MTRKITIFDVNTTYPVWEHHNPTEWGLAIGWPNFMAEGWLASTSKQMEAVEAGISPIVSDIPV